MTNDYVGKSELVRHSARSIVTLCKRPTCDKEIVDSIIYHARQIDKATMPSDITLKVMTRYTRDCLETKIPYAHPTEIAIEGNEVILSNGEYLTAYAWNGARLQAINRRDQWTQAKQELALGIDPRSKPRKIRKKQND
jgi:hypothetical protein